MRYFPVRLPKRISSVSPVFTSAPGLAVRPFRLTRPPEQASFATVRRLMMRDTFRNLSSLIL